MKKDAMTDASRDATHSPPTAEDIIAGIESIGASINEMIDRLIAEKAVLKEQNAEMRRLLERWATWHLDADPPRSPLLETQLLLSRTHGGP